jgi:hypothetical protein
MHDSPTTPEEKCLSYWEKDQKEKLWRGVAGVYGFLLVQLRCDCVGTEQTHGQRAQQEYSVCAAQSFAPLIQPIDDFGEVIGIRNA